MGSSGLTGSGVMNLGAIVPGAEHVFAVFRQDSKNDAHVHVGDVHAPDAEMALILAKEQFARRDPCVCIAAPSTKTWITITSAQVSAG